MTRLYALILWLFLVACVSAPSEAQTVYITKTGAKYHRNDCHYLKYSKFSISLSEAKKRSYTPCSICKPGTTVPKKITEPEIDSVQQETKIIRLTPAEEAPQKNVTAPSQCTARTKAGTRCKRMTTNANGLCWQHQ
jgi:hypothetical protein